MPRAYETPRTKSATVKNLTARRCPMAGILSDVDDTCGARPRERDLCFLMGECRTECREPAEDLHREARRLVESLFHSGKGDDHDALIEELRCGKLPGVAKCSAGHYLTERVSACDWDIWTENVLHCSNLGAWT